MVRPRLLYGPGPSADLWFYRRDAWKSVEDEEPATAKANYVAKLIDVCVSLASSVVTCTLISPMQILKNASGDEAKEYLAQLEAA